ncbi:hypothetical protein L7F22_065350 [Adiantum nelumboides]|nr:hypothetical protein [Adiantum nelumboides]
MPAVMPSVALSRSCLLLSSRIHRCELPNAVTKTTKTPIASRVVKSKASGVWMMEGAETRSLLPSEVVFQLLSLASAPPASTVARAYTGGNNLGASG